MKEEKRKAIIEANKKRFLKKFGTLDIRELLGEDVLSLKKSIHDRLLEFGDSHTSHWIKTYLPDDLKWLIPYQDLFRTKKSTESNRQRSDKRKEEFLLKTFGTTSIEEILGEKVLKGEQSLYARFRELGKYTPSQTTRFIRTYASEEIKKRLYPYLDVAETLFNESYNESQRLAMSEQAKNGIVLSFAKYGKAAFRAFTTEENREFLNSVGIEPLELVSSTTRGTFFKGRCLSCGRENEFYFHSNRITSVCPYCSDAGKSQTEIKIQATLEAAGIMVQPKKRGIVKSLSGFQQEIDLYLPELKIGFEINGALTHNSGVTPFNSSVKSKSYHKDKTESALSNGVRLYHIWEHWSDKISLEELVLAKCRVFKKTYQARKLALKQNVPLEVAKNFLDHNHKQGFCKTSLSLALYEDQTLVQFIGFIISGNKAELVRNATIQGCQVIGGISRLFKHSVDLLKEKGIKLITTYADRDLTPDYKSSVYTRLGFSFKGEVGSTMSFYVYKNRQYFEKQVYHRRYFQKKMLRKKLSVIPGWEFKENETELENLARAGIYPIYNSGCFKFEFSL